MKRRSRLDIHTALPEFLMFLPAFILYGIFTLFTLIGGLYYSMTDWNGTDVSYDFIGLENYITLATDSYVITPLINTVTYAFFTTIFINVFALFFAVMLDHELKSKNFLRACIFLPVVLSPLVTGYIFKFIFSEPLQDIGKILGVEVLANNILGSTEYALYATVFAATWKGLGWYMVIYIAGLQAVDRSLYEAAEIDGARPWKRFTKITFPLIAPAFTINMVLSVERAFKEFDMVYSLTGGGPGNSTQLLAHVIYQESFANKRAGYGSAVGIVLFVIIVAISLFQLKFLRKKEEDLG